MWGTAEDLHNLLRLSGIEGPFVLVGQSIGGLYVRALADQHPDEVVGMVLLDSVHPEKYDRYPEYLEQDRSFALIGSTFPTMARLGLFRLYFATGGEIDFQELPPRQHDELASFWSKPSYFHSSQSEGRLAVQIHEQGQALNGLGDMPLAVITAGINEPSWLAMQEELPLLSTNSTHLTIPDATHSSLMFNPDHAHQTSMAIMEVVQAARGGD
jgi:pimeloyl-ACP methyl ester carboxylesterase